MQRSTKNVSNPGFLADPTTFERGPGRQIDWNQVPASYEGDDGVKRLPAGTVLSVQADGTAFPRAQADTTANPSHTAQEILLSGADAESRTDAATGYGVIVGGVVYENLLPDFGNANFGTFKTELEDAGTGFTWRTYGDNRA